MHSSVANSRGVTMIAWCYNRTNPKGHSGTLKSNSPIPHAAMRENNTASSVFRRGILACWSILRIREHLNREAWVNLNFYQRYHRCESMLICEGRSGLGMGLGFDRHCCCQTAPFLGSICLHPAPTPPHFAHPILFSSIPLPARPYLHWWASRVLWNMEPLWFVVAARHWHSCVCDSCKVHYAGGMHILLA